MTIDNIESVAVIGGGPSGLAALHALKSELKYKKIRLFERKSEPGGLWYVQYKLVILFNDS